MVFQCCPKGGFTSRIGYGKVGGVIARFVTLRSDGVTTKKMVNVNICFSI